ncbi:hypothetical protein I7I53_03781 [Histoplasma capsulatum var. duboisii H88]|uniref:Uncharacterized protein n=1 Tax=Ajellomyces capsulatus (strain H88) TaxID=544711 RepID=A0A8A1LPD8_AJEC8|nr:hypothetical protein I7I53_03781 [Histoplasma capsulatum var. duboisii H88]
MRPMLTYICFRINRETRNAGKIFIKVFRSHISIFFGCESMQTTVPCWKLLPWVNHDKNSS